MSGRRLSPWHLLFLSLVLVLQANAVQDESSHAQGRHRLFKKPLARRQLPPENALLTAIDHLGKEVEVAALADKRDKTLLPNEEDTVAPTASGLTRIAGYAIAAVGILSVLAATFRLIFLEKRVDEDLDTITVILLCGAYISIASASDMLVKMETQAHGGEMPFSPSRMVFMVEFMKLVITIPVVLGRHAYGSFSCPPMSECATAMRLMVIPAVSYSVNNAIILMVVSHVDFASLSVWRQLTPLFVAMIWVLVFRLPLGSQRWLALLILLFGTMVNSYAQGTFMSRWNPMLIAVLGSCCTTAVAGVANEYVLKQCVRMDIDFLCIFLYIQTTAFSFFLVVVGRGMSPSGSSSGGEAVEASNAEWTLLGGPPLLQEPAQLAIVGLQVLFGFAVARVIRHLGAVPRAIMNAMKELTVVIIAPVFVSSRITTPCIVSAIIVGGAAAMFSTASAAIKGPSKPRSAPFPVSRPVQGAAEASPMHKRLSAQA